MVMAVVLDLPPPRRPPAPLPPPLSKRSLPRQSHHSTLETATYHRKNRAVIRTANALSCGRPSLAPSGLVARVADLVQRASLGRLFSEDRTERKQEPTRETQTGTATLDNKRAIFFLVQPNGPAGPPGCLRARIFCKEGLAAFRRGDFISTPTRSKPRVIRAIRFRPRARVLSLRGRRMRGPLSNSPCPQLRGLLIGK